MLSWVRWVLLGYGSLVGLRYALLRLVKVSLVELWLLSWVKECCAEVCCGLAVVFGYVKFCFVVVRLGMAVVLGYVAL